MLQKLRNMVASAKEYGTVGFNKALHVYSVADEEYKALVLESGVGTFTDLRTHWMSYFLATRYYNAVRRFHFGAEDYRFLNYLWLHLRRSRNALARVSLNTKCNAIANGRLLCDFFVFSDKLTLMEERAAQLTKEGFSIRAPDTRPFLDILLECPNLWEYVDSAFLTMYYLHLGVIALQAQRHCAFLTCMSLTIDWFTQFEVHKARVRRIISLVETPRDVLYSDLYTFTMEEFPFADEELRNHLSSSYSPFEDYVRSYLSAFQPPMEIAEKQLEDGTVFDTDGGAFPYLRLESF